MSDPIRKEVHVACSVEHAFKTFCEQIDLWWPPSHRPARTRRLVLEPEVGGAFVAIKDDGEQVRLGEVIHADHPTELRYTWNPGRGVGPTEVRLTFEAADDGTLVRVLHLEATAELGEEWPQRATIFDNAWTQVLAAYTQFQSENEEC